VLELIVKRGPALVDARSLLVLLQEDDALVVAGSTSDVAVGTTLPLDGTLAGSVLTTGAAERVPSVADRLGHGLDVVSAGVASALVAPPGFRGRARGVLAAFDRGHESPMSVPDDEHLLSVFGASAAIAIATAQSVERERLRDSIRASQAERKRWARELHDETLQELGALKLALESALARGEPGALSTAASAVVDQQPVRGRGAEQRDPAQDNNSELAAAASTSSSPLSVPLMDTYTNTTTASVAKPASSRSARSRVALRARFSSPCRERHQHHQGKRPTSSPRHPRPSPRRSQQQRPRDSGDDERGVSTPSATTALPPAITTRSTAATSVDDTPSANTPSLTAPEKRD
jgi:GAF domain/Histidine kinase